MTAIAKRLRELAPEYDTDGVMLEAAAEIERLEAKCAQTDRYIALLNGEIADNGQLRDEIERYRAEVARINRATDREIDVAITKARLRE